MRRFILCVLFPFYFASCFSSPAIKLASAEKEELKPNTERVISNDLDEITDKSSKSVIEELIEPVETGQVPDMPIGNSVKEGVSLPEPELGLEENNELGNDINDQTLGNAHGDLELRSIEGILDDIEYIDVTESEDYPTHKDNHEEFEPKMADNDENINFDPSSISPEVFDSTKAEVQALILLLNEIIRERNFNTWKTYLSARYEDAVSNPLFLDRVSQSTILRRQNIVLKTLRDYFIHVVVPSRANDRVDDIEFFGTNRVKAYTINNKGQRLRLYDLELTQEGWKIIN